MSELHGLYMKKVNITEKDFDNTHQIWNALNVVNDILTEKGIDLKQ